MQPWRQFNLRYRLLCLVTGRSLLLQWSAPNSALRTGAAMYANIRVRAAVLGSLMQDPDQTGLPGLQAENESLQRVYGISFPDKKMMTLYKVCPFRLHVVITGYA